MLALGVLISIKLGIYLPGTGGVWHSDSVLIIGSSRKSLIHYPTWRPYNPEAKPLRR